jgi:hypothetical protein
MIRLALLACAAVLLLLTACGGTGTKPPARGPRTAAPELTSIDQLETAFDGHQGVPQLIVLISPT